jgi:hypothetical protein
MRIYFYAIAFLFFQFTNLWAQDDLSSLVDAELNNTAEYALGTFFTTRILTSHSTELMPRGGLDFRIHHRFEEFSSGFGRFYGLDGSSSYLSLEYGFTNRCMAGFGRANDGFFNFFGKVKLFRQSKGTKNMPVTIVYLVSSAVDAKSYPNKVINDDLDARFRYTHQLLIARMFNPRLSLQFSPTLVHRNMIPKKKYQNDLFSVGFGGRFKLTNTLSVNAEYFVVNWSKNAGPGDELHNPVSIGVDIQVASHVFQIMITNTDRMIEHAFIGETRKDFLKGLRLGFNISQVFTPGKKKEKKD